MLQKKSLGKILVLATLVLGFTLSHGMETDANAGIIIGVSRAGYCIPFHSGAGLLHAMESVTWDMQLMFAPTRHRYAISYHFDKVGNKWRQLHSVHSGWVKGWTTGTAAAHYGETFPNRAVVGDHWVYSPSQRKALYLGRTQAINTCDGMPKRFINDNGKNL